MARQAALRRLWRGLLDGQGSRSIHTSAVAAQQAQPAPDTIEVFVNDEPVHIPKGASVLEACDAAGIDIPRCASAVVAVPFGPSAVVACHACMRVLCMLTTRAHTPPNCAMQVLLSPAPVCRGQLPHVPRGGTLFSLA